MEKKLIKELNIKINSKAYITKFKEYFLLENLLRFLSFFHKLEK